MGKTKEFSVAYEKETKENGATAYGGFGPLLQFLSAIGFVEIVEKSMPARSQQGYAPVQYLLGLILLNWSGGESVSDIEALEQDSGLKRLIKQWENSFSQLKDRFFSKGRTRIFPSCSRIFNFLNGFNDLNEDRERESTPEGTSKILQPSEEFSKLVDINREIIHKAAKLNPQTVATLDMDNNLVISKKSNAKYSYKKTPSYGPFNVFWDEMDMMLYSEFRDGNVPPGKEQARVLKEALCQLPSTVEKVYHRSDSAGYQHELLEFMDSGTSRFGKIEFAVSANVTQNIRKLARELPENQWQSVKYLDENGLEVMTKQEVAEVVYVPETKNKSKNAPVFRTIVTRELINAQGTFNEEGELSFDFSETAEKKLHIEQMGEGAYKVFAVVTNRNEIPLEILLWHRKRCGRSEEEHARLTNDMAAGRFPSDSFGENAAWWMIAIISLNILKFFQRDILPKQFKRSRIKKLNLYFLRVVMRIVKSGHGLKIKIPFQSKISEFIDGILENLILIKARLPD